MGEVRDYYPVGWQNKKKPRRDCAYCGKPLVYGKQAPSTKRYCDRRCADRYRHQHMTPMRRSQLNNGALAYYYRHRTCCLEKMYLWRARNPERVREYDRLYTETHRAELNDYARAYQRQRRDGERLRRLMNLHQLEATLASWTPSPPAPASIPTSATSS